VTIGQGDGRHTTLPPLSSRREPRSCSPTPYTTLLTGMFNVLPQKCMIINPHWLSHHVLFRKICFYEQWAYILKFCQNIFNIIKNWSLVSRGKIARVILTTTDKTKFRAFKVSTNALKTIRLETPSDINGKADSYKSFETIYKKGLISQLMDDYSI